MALTICGECGREISSKAVACPGCGCPKTSDQEAEIEVAAATEPRVRVTIDNPYSMGRVIASGATTASRSPVWGRLYETLLTLAKVLWVLIAALGAVIAQREREPLLVILVFWFGGLIPYAVLRGLEMWIGWLRRRPED